MPFGAASELDLAQLEQTPVSHSISENYLIRLLVLNWLAVKRHNKLLWLQLGLARRVLAELVDVEAGLTSLHLLIVMNENVLPLKRGLQDFGLIRDIYDCHFLAGRCGSSERPRVSAIIVIPPKIRLISKTRLIYHLLGRTLRAVPSSDLS